MADEVGRMQVVLGADTAKHDQALEKSAEVAGASSKAMKKAAQQAADAQARAAKYAADEVTEQGSRILAARKMLAESLQNEKALGRDLAKQRIDEATGSAALAAAIQREVIARKELAASMALGREPSHGSFTDQMAASSVVRELNGNGGIRSIERFLTIIPGVSGALRTLFPIIGAAGLAGLLFDMGERGVEAFEKIQGAADATRSAFQDQHDKAQITIDDLEIENQKIQDQIDKLSGHPNNGLATALLEAKKMADALVDSLQEDRKQLEALLKEHDTGFLGKVFGGLGLGPASTGQQQEEMLADQLGLTEAARRARGSYDEEMAGAKDDGARKAATARYNAAVRAAFQSQIDTYTGEAVRLKKAQDDANQRTMESFTATQGQVGMGSMVDNTQKIADAQGRVQQLQDMMQREMLNASIYSRNVTLGGLKQDKGSASDKAAEAQMKGFEDTLNKRKLDEQLGIVDEINFWEAMLVPAQQYADNVQKINEKLAGLTQEYYRMLDQIAAKAVAEQKRAQEQLQRQDEQMLSMMKQWEEQDSRRAAAQAKLAEAQTKNADAMAEQAIQFQVMTGALSRHDAAVQMAALHAADYRAQLEELDREEAEDKQRSMLTEDERATRQADRDIRRTNITGERNRSAISDQQQIDNTTLLGASTDALREFTAQALDSAKQMQEFVSNALSSVNDAILSGKKGSFREAGGQIAKSGARALLQEAEGRMLKALGLSDKKPKGTPTDPIYVKQVGGGGQTSSDGSGGLASILQGFGGGGVADSLSSAVSGGASSAISGIGGLLSGLGGDTAVADTISTAVEGGADAGAGIGTFLSGLGDLAFFADGTPPLSADTMAIVGERGPELLNLPRGSSVTPNHALPKMGGDTHMYSIDARGSTDPAQTEAAVHRVMQQYVPGIVQASVGANRDAALRRPRTSF